MPRAAPKSESQLDATMRIVVLHGKDVYLLRERTRLLAEALEAQFGPIERFTFDGASVSPAAVLDELRSYGLIQHHKLVIVDHADVFLAGGKGADDDDDANDAAGGGGGPNRVRPLMEKYAAAPVPDATLLLRAETWRAGNLDKLIAKVGTILKCEAPGEDRAVEWCIDRCERRYDCSIDRDAAELLVQRIGPDLARLDMELQKLAASVDFAGRIDVAAVETMTPPGRQEKAWLIQEAILTGDRAAAMSKLHELLEVSRQDEVPVMWSIVDVVRKLHAAAQMLRDGQSEGTIFKTLKLWGDAGSRTIAAAKRVEPARLAALLQTAVEADQHAKTGLAEPRRCLEGLTILVTDTIAAR